MSTGIDIVGWGAVSPAGWSAHALHEAVSARANLPITTEQRGPGAPHRQFRSVPALPAPPAWLRQPRLRRTSPIGRFTVHAALEALGDPALPLIPEVADATGLIFVTQNGSVNYSRRFYAEVLNDPLLASPILFPETVFNAPGSHLAALIGTAGPSYTLVGDATEFLNAMITGAQWIDQGLVRDCLIVAAEELDWLSTEALHLFPGLQIGTEGAAAILIRRSNQSSPGTIQLESITDPVQSSAFAENAPAGVLGHGFSVSSAWQIVFACEAMRAQALSTASVLSRDTHHRLITTTLTRA
ncbi:MAG: hypothetical protein H7A55_04425 [Verrucomicrobiaceae bacterium]|nr:hypothetical protein [Verrucomicrobiaceae bacterium]